MKTLTVGESGTAAAEVLDALTSLRLFTEARLRTRNDPGRTKTWTTFT